MKEPVTNFIARWVLYFIPLGFIIILTQKYLKATDSHYKTKWTRLYSSYGRKGFNGAEVLIRNEKTNQTNGD